MKTPKLLFNEVETSKIIDRAVQTLRNDRQNRRGLPYIKNGGSVRYSLDDIRRHIEQNRICFDDSEKIVRLSRKSAEAEINNDCTDEEDGGDEKN